jgi:hypothetical protein
VAFRALFPKHDMVYQDSAQGFVAEVFVQIRVVVHEGGRTGRRWEPFDQISIADILESK